MLSHIPSVEKILNDNKTIQEIIIEFQENPIVRQHRNRTGIEPKKTLKKAIVTGPKASVAILILKNAEDHISASNTNNV